jgi:hypothetical protein
MTADENSKFKMQTDDEKPDFQSQEDIDNFQLEKLNKRVTRISILILGLIVVVSLAVYLDLKKSISLTDSAGIIGVKALSKDLQSKFSSLSIRQANLEDDLTKRIEAIEKSTASIQANMNKVTTAINQIRSARKTDNEKFEGSTTTLDKKLSLLSGDLETMASNLKNIDNTVNNQLESLSQMIGSAKKDLVNIRADIDSVKSFTIDKKTVDVLLKNQQEAYQLALQKITSNLEGKIDSVENKLKEMEKDILHQKPKP